MKINAVYAAIGRLGNDRQIFSKFRLCNFSDIVVKNK